MSARTYIKGGDPSWPINPGWTSHRSKTGTSLIPRKDFCLQFKENPTKITYGSPMSVVDIERQADETQRQDTVRRRPCDDVISV